MVFFNKMVYEFSQNDMFFLQNGIYIIFYIIYNKMNVCTLCNITFSTKCSLKRHNESNRHKKKESNSTSYHECDCGKLFQYKSGLYRHKKQCSSIRHISIPDQMQQIQESHQKEIDELRGQIEALTKTSTTTTTTNNNTQNASNINNITIINPFGQENVDKISPDYFVYCLNRIYNSSPTLAEKIYSYPENQNIRIPNKNKPYASVQIENGESKLEMLDKALDEIEIFCFTLLEEKFTDLEYRKKMSEMKQRAFENYMDAYENDNKGSIRKNIRSALKLMVLNK